MFNKNGVMKSIFQFIVIDLYDFKKTFTIFMKDTQI